ncbi:hypothetical protein NC653_034023 [Populus alba x Populus x berolinensis]|uniref:DUF4283 domain-containing protein n=1 Tax=Populus alba x Populus x berolinensis TaxID=444605 RepID=A0AAD6LVF1_9ROSI|nr:hypothetical protein NC653_034023 [Populus alba x Populus x berolinensis]
MPEYFDFSSFNMHTIPVWVKFPNLPLKCWFLKCLSKIASGLSKPVQSDILTSSMSKLSCARVLVEVNLLYNLPYSIEVTLPNGSLLHQQVVYETLPCFCKHYRTLGHITSTCTKSPPPNVPSKQQAHNSIALVPKGKDSIFNRLGPQEGTSVVECSEANLPADCVPNSIQVEAKPVSMCGANARNFGAQRITHMVHMDRQLSPLYSVAHDILAPPPKDLAGYRTNKGKSVVVSGAPAMMHLLQVLSSDWVPVVVAVVADFFFSGLQLAFVVNDLFVLQFSMWVLGFSLFCFVSYLSPNDRQSYMAPLHG